MVDKSACGNNKGVLVIYTGGTVGSAPRDPGDMDSPKVVVSRERLWEAMPELQVLQRRGCCVDCISFETPMDSCNVNPIHWTRMARIIFDNYEKYEGFVILHGTDTMAYSASMLSFMLRDLGKPVVLTGAQRSALVDVRNDAKQNFISAILVANPRYSKIPLIPEVVICFGGLILRGNRTVKEETSGYTAYRSPNLEPIGEIGDRIFINERLVAQPPGNERRFHIRTRLETDVMPLFIYPGISVTQVRNQLNLPGLKAVVVLAYGTGNIPSSPDFIAEFRRARQERGIILAIVSQCNRGPVELGMYEGSAALLEAGFISAGDITVAAAQCKLMSLLGEPDYEIEEVEADFQVSSVGEQNISQYVTRLSTHKHLLEKKSADKHPARFRFPRRSLVGHWDPRRIDRAIIRLRHGQIHTPDNAPLNIRVFVNVDPDEPLTPDHPNLVGEYKKWPMQTPGLVVFNATDVIRSLANPGERLSITFALDSGTGSISWESAELALFVREVGV